MVQVATFGGGLNDFPVPANHRRRSRCRANKPWVNQYDINLTGDALGAWTTGTALPAPLRGSQAIVTKNRVYLLGGYNGSTFVTTVYTAPINSDGTLGSWTTSSSLPAAFYVAQAIATKNRVYVLGGSNGNSLSSIYTAAINADGTLGTWTAYGTLPTQSSWASSFITRNRIYLLGGHDGSNYTSAIWTTQINSDGSLGTWENVGALPGVIHTAAVIVTRNRVYLLSGRNNSGYNNIAYTAPIDSDGILGTWVAAGSPPQTYSGAQAFVTRNRAYLIGGRDANAAQTVTYTASVNADGTLGTWTTSNPLPAPNHGCELIVTGSRVYALGGYGNSINSSTAVATVYAATLEGGLNDYSEHYGIPVDSLQHVGAGRPYCQQYHFNTSVSGDLGAWDTAARLDMSATLYGGKQLYVVNDSIHFVPTSHPTSSNNCAISLTEAGSYDNQALYAFSSSAGRDKSLGLHLKGHYLLFGGETYSAPTYAATGEVLGATVAEDGTLGAMVTVGTLPATRYKHTGFVGPDGRVYLIGGIVGGHDSAGTITNSVISCHFDPVSKTLYGFRNEATLPVALCSAEVIVTKNKVYLIGGASGNQTTGTNKVYVASIGADGILSSWTQHGTFPVNLHSCTVFVTRTMAYVFGGSHLTTKCSHVYRAPISPDGTLGSWTAGTDMPVASDSLQAICVSGRLYLKQFGSSSGHIGSVPMVGGGNDYYRYGSEAIDPFDPVDFALPDVTPSVPGVYAYHQVLIRRAQRELPGPLLSMPIMLKLTWISSFKL